MDGGRARLRDLLRDPAAARRLPHPHAPLRDGGVAGHARLRAHVGGGRDPGRDLPGPALRLDLRHPDALLHRGGCGGTLDRGGHVRRRLALGVHPRRPPADRGRHPGRAPLGARGHRAAGAARLGAGPPAGGRPARAPGVAGGRRGGPHRPPRAPRVRARDGRAPHRGPRPGAAARDALRADHRARPRPLHPDPHRRRHPLGGRRRATARGLLRPVPAAALRLRADPVPDLRDRGRDRPAAGRGDPGRRAGHLPPPHPLAPVGQPPQPRAIARLQGLRCRVPRRDPGAADAGRLRPERRARPTARGARALALPGHHVAARNQHHGPRHQRRVHRARRRGRPRARGPSRAGREHGADRPGGGADARGRDLPPAPRAARGAPPGHARPLRRPGHPRPARRPAAGPRPEHSLHREPDSTLDHLRARHLRLPGRPPAGAARPRVPGGGGRARRRGGRERRRQVHDLAAPAALRGPERGARDGGRARPARALAPRPATPDRGGEPGHLSLPRHRRGQPAHGPARRDPGRARGRRAQRQSPARSCATRRS